MSSETDKSNRRTQVIGLLRFVSITPADKETIHIGISANATPKQQKAALSVINGISSDHQKTTLLTHFAKITGLSVSSRMADSASGSTSPAQGVTPPPPGLILGGSGGATAEAGGGSGLTPVLPASPGGGSGSLLALHAARAGSALGIAATPGLTDEGDEDNLMVPSFPAASGLRPSPFPLRGRRGGAPPDTGDGGRGGIGDGSSTSGAGGTAAPPQCIPSPEQYSAVVAAATALGRIVQVMDAAIAADRGTPKKSLLTKLNPFSRQRGGARKSRKHSGIRNRKTQRRK